MTRFGDKQICVVSRLNNYDGLNLKVNWLAQFAVALIFNEGLKIHEGAMSGLMVFLICTRSFDFPRRTRVICKHQGCSVTSMHF